MKLDFDTVADVADYVTVPAGTYVCKIAEVQTGATRAGDERWSFKLIVAEGEFTGRHAAWDNLVFSQRGMSRVRAVLGALGLPNRGSVEVEPSDLEGREAFVEVRPSEYEHPDSGTTVRRNEVPYAGYRRIEDDSGKTDTIPF
ncbi:MAG: DUF669 domain-containing protein [Planctomycetes bacterium]|nr:DUF669 domain-containing protein [Planctomycetota bacterium]